MTDKKLKLLITTLLLLLVPYTSVWAQKEKPWVVRTLNKVDAFIDSMATRGIDKRYIEVPKRPWQVVLKFNTNDMDLMTTSTLSRTYLSKKGINGEANMENSLKPSMSFSVGAWVGYRGYGLGYSFNLTHKNGSNFTIGATGSNYGINLRLRNFSTSKMDYHMWGNDDGETFDEKEKDVELWDNIDVHTFILDGFYMFNGKRFSHAAAYDQSVKQIRSAGSLMVGAMWYQSSVDYSARNNALMIQLMGNVGRIKIQEGSIGIGYAYNWVPVKNLLINVTALPMIALYNRAKIHIYDSNYDIFLEEDEESPTGKKAVRENDDSWLEDVTLEEKATVVKHGKVSFNINARMSVTYNFDRYFLNVYGQWNHFNNKIEESSLKLTDWYINASLGIRL